MLFLLILACTATLMLVDRFRLGSGSHPYSRLGLPDSYFGSPSHIVIICYVHLHYFLMLVLLPVMLPSTGAMLWHAAEFASISLSCVCRLMASAVLVYAIVLFAFRRVRDSRFRLADSLLASFEIVFICSTFYAVPQDGG